MGVQCHIIGFRGTVSQDWIYTRGTVSQNWIYRYNITRLDLEVQYHTRLDLDVQCHKIEFIGTVSQDWI